MVAEARLTSFFFSNPNCSLLLLSFSFFKNYLPVKPLPLWATEMRFLSLWFWEDFSSSIFSIKNSLQITSTTTMLKVDRFGEGTEMSILDLPELVLECILEKLPPSGLCTMACVCSSLRHRCMSDHLWKKHMKQKWGRIIGPAAYRHWHCHINMNMTSTNENDSISINNPKPGKQKVWMQLLSLVRSFSFIGILRPKLDHTYKQKTSVDSIMSWYLALDTGRFWFPAQVYNRENGHVGFMLSCYDAELSYDPRTDSFNARYPPHGRRVVAIEHGVSWERLRAPPVDTSSHDLHISDCLNDLHPGDHIEIQWRRNKEFPYGWWYGVVGHLELCDGNENYCRCDSSGTVVLEFNQYTPGSRWRKTTINRKDHREEGNEAEGFYGGIRKLKSKKEISTWKRLWPVEVLE